MNRLAMRILGFAIPNVAFVIALHVDKQPTSGEALDGLVSGIAFTLPFLAVTGLRSWLEGDRAGARARGAGKEFLFGIFAAFVAWAALWVGWSLPAVQSQRANAFWWNCAVIAIVGLALPAAGRGRSREGDKDTLEAPIPTP